MTMTFEQMQSLMEQTILGLAEIKEIAAQNTRDIRETRADLRETRAISEQNTRELTRIEVIVESNARAIEATNNSLNAKFDQMVTATIRSQDRLERLERRDKKYDREIKGLRIETRRMLERWLGEPFTDDPDDDSDVDETS